MKVHPVILLALLLAAPSTWAESPSGDLQSLRVIDSQLPAFPYDLMQLGVREGEVRVAFSVDSTGRVEDCLAVYYTHPEFARVSVAAIRKWKFEPARFNGTPIAAATEVTVNFEVQGTVVVSLNSSEMINARLYALTERPDIYRPRMLKELDRIPTPISAPAPLFPTQLADRGRGGPVVVSFYIDENGAVRLPSVNSGSDPELAAIAIVALRNWKFEPPTCKGRPVLVRASQQFNFRPTKPAVAAGG